MIVLKLEDKYKNALDLVADILRGQIAGSADNKEIEKENKNLEELVIKFKKAVKNEGQRVGGGLYVR